MAVSDRLHERGCAVLVYTPADGHKGSRHKNEEKTPGEKKKRGDCKQGWAASERRKERRTFDLDVDDGGLLEDEEDAVDVPFGGCDPERRDHVVRGVADGWGWKRRCVEDGGGKERRLKERWRWIAGVKTY